MRKSDDFVRLKTATSELRSVEFQEDMPYPDQMAFWINLYNCLIIHLHVSVTASVTSALPTLSLS